MVLFGQLLLVLLSTIAVAVAVIALLVIVVILCRAAGAVLLLRLVELRPPERLPVLHPGQVAQDRAREDPYYQDLSMGPYYDDSSVSEDVVRQHFV